LQLEQCWGPIQSHLAAPAHQALKQKTSARKVFAQQLLDRAMSNHPEVTQLELAVRSAGGCSTIAASDPKGIGERCDHDELEAMRTGESVVEKEGDVFDVTVPLHDMAGKIIGTVGMDFKIEPGVQRLNVVTRQQVSPS
jgi:hypothetical protein